MIKVALKILGILIITSFFLRLTELFPLPAYPDNETVQLINAVNGYKDVDANSMYLNNWIERIYSFIIMLFGMFTGYLVYKANKYRLIILLIAFGVYLVETRPYMLFHDIATSENSLNFISNVYSLLPIFKFNFELVLPVVLTITLLLELFTLISSNKSLKQTD